MLANKRIQKTTYDRNNDILYVSFANAQGKSYADGGPFGIEIMRDWNTEEITGLSLQRWRKARKSTSCWGRSNPW